MKIRVLLKNIVHKIVIFKTVNINRFAELT